MASVYQDFQIHLDGALGYVLHILRTSQRFRWGGRGAVVERLEPSPARPRGLAGCPLYMEAYDSAIERGDKLGMYVE